MKKTLSQESFTSTPTDLNDVFDGEYKEPIRIMKKKVGEDFNAALELCETTNNQFEKD